MSKIEDNQLSVDALEFPIETKRGGVDPRSWENVEALFSWLELKIRRNEFTGHDEVDGRTLTDDVLINIYDEAHRAGLRVTRDFLLDRLKATALENRYHPVRRYFRKLEWDGKPRLDKWLITYLGAEDTPFNRAVSAIVLIAAVRRIRKPGTKFDTMLILEGIQGSGKSSALKTIAVNEDWFTDCVSLKHDPKVLIEQTAGKFIVEVPELSGMRHADIEHIKASLSRTRDTARKAYDRLTAEVHRQFVVVGTTNVDDEGRAAYLKDPTGNRRFWPVLTDEVDLRGLKRDRDQLWAEAAEREHDGESIVLPQHLWRSAEREQNDRMPTDPYEEVLVANLGSVEKIQTEHIWELIGKKAAQMHQSDMDRVGRIMRKLGFTRKRLRTGNGDRPYFYVRG
jgi:predicted P-loop ATPase